MRARLITRCGCTACVEIGRPYPYIERELFQELSVEQGPTTTHTTMPRMCRRFKYVRMLSDDDAEYMEETP